MRPKLRQCLTFSALAAVSLLLVTTGCKKSSSGSGNSFSGSFNGTAFQPSLIEAIDESPVMSVVGLQVKAGDSIAAIISFFDTAAVNSSFDFSGGEIEYEDQKSSDDFDSDNTPSHGLIKITAFDHTNKRVAGTYSGVIYDASGLDSIVVANGQFSSAYTVF